MVSMSMLTFEDSLRRAKPDLSRKYSQNWVLRLIRGTLHAADARSQQHRMKRLTVKHLDRKSDGVNHRDYLQFMKHLLRITWILKASKSNMERKRENILRGQTETGLGHVSQPLQTQFTHHKKGGNNTVLVINGYWTFRNNENKYHGSMLEALNKGNIRIPGIQWFLL